MGAASHSCWTFRTKLCGTQSAPPKRSPSTDCLPLPSSAPLRPLVPGDLADARRGLEGLVVLVTEYLESPASVAYAAARLCFRADGGRAPVFPDAEGANRTVPDFRRKSPFGGGGSAARPPGWAPAPAALERLFAANALDLDLFDGVAADFRARAPGAYPALAPRDAATYRAALRRRTYVQGGTRATRA